MLRFILLLGFGTLHSQMISIHLMLRFIHNFSSFMRFVLIFQYISCYGLSLDARQGNVLKGNFNTSHVTVYPNVVLQCSRYWRISIHLMLRFIMKNLSNMTLKQIISIHLMLRFIIKPRSTA